MAPLPTFSWSTPSSTTSALTGDFLPSQPPPTAASAPSLFGASVTSSADATPSRSSGAATSSDVGSSASGTTATTTASMSLARTDFLLAQVVVSQQRLAKQMELTAAAVARIAGCQEFGSEESLPEPLHLPPTTCKGVRSCKDWDGRTLPHQEQPMVAAWEVFNEFPVKDMVWDEETPPDLDFHNGILQQLAQGELSAQTNVVVVGPNDIALTEVDGMINTVDKDSAGVSSPFCENCVLIEDPAHEQQSCQNAMVNAGVCSEFRLHLSGDEITPAASTPTSGDVLPFSLHLSSENAALLSSAQANNSPQILDSGTCKCPLEVPSVDGQAQEVNAVPKNQLEIRALENEDKLLEVCRVANKEINIPAAVGAEVISAGNSANLTNNVCSSEVTTRASILENVSHTGGNTFMPTQVDVIELGTCRLVQVVFGKKKMAKVDTFIFISESTVNWKADFIAEEAVKLKPSFADAYLNQGNVYKAKGMSEDAIMCYQCALQARPNYAMAYGNLATIYYEQDQLNRAVCCYNQAIVCDPQFVEAYMGNALKDARRVEEANNCYRTLTDLGNIYMEWNWMSDVASFYKAAISMTSGLSSPLNKLAVIYKQWDPGIKLGTTLISWHLLVTFCCLHVALCMKLFEHKPFEARTVIGFGVLNGFSIGLINLSLCFNSVGFYQMTKLAIIPCTIILQTLFFRKKFSRKIQLSLSVLFFGVGVATVTDLQLNAMGSVLSLLAIVTTCIAQIMTNTIQKKFKVSSTQLLYQSCQYQALTLFIIGPFLDGIFMNQNVFAFNYTSQVLFFIVLSCLISVSVNFSTFLVIGQTSPVTYQVLDHLKTCLVLTLVYVLLHDPLSWRNILGILIAVIEMVLYSYFCSLETQQKPTEASPQVIQVKENDSAPLISDSLSKVENGAGVIDDQPLKAPMWSKWQAMLLLGDKQNFKGAVMSHLGRSHL